MLLEQRQGTQQLTVYCTPDEDADAILGQLGIRGVGMRVMDGYKVVSCAFPAARDLEELYADAAFPLSSEFRIEKVACRSCTGSVLHCSEMKIKPLPSEHWLEMADLWICHPTDDAKQYGIEFEPIQARQGMLLVGRDHLLVSPNDVPSPHCFSCNALLGTQEDDGGIRLLKHCLVSLPHDTFHHYTFEACFCEQLLEYAGAHNVYRFTITDPSSTQTVSITLFDWCVRSTSNPPITSLGLAVKLLYTITTTPTSDAVPIQLLPGQTPCLLRLLDTRNAAYPPSLRSLKQQRIALLRRLVLR